MTCRLCKADPQPSVLGDPRKCAWPDGTFTHDNWNCGTLNLVRHQAEDMGTTDWNEDVHMCTVRLEYGWLVLSWYKSRGRTGVAVVVTDESVEPLTLGEAREFTEAGSLGL